MAEEGLNLEERLVTFIEKERAAAWRDALATYELPVEERVGEGRCIAGLGLKEFSGDLIRFGVARNDSRFRPGDPVFLNDGTDIWSGLRCEFLDYDPVAGEVILAPDRFSRQDFDEQDLESLDVIDARVIDMSSKRLEAVHTVFLDDYFEGVRSVLNRKHRKRSFEDELSEAKALAGGLRLNPSQESAFLDACSSSLSLVQGPPGTGKTYLLACVAGAMAAAGKRVLVCCFTHRAINNALNTIAGTASSCSVFKICREHYVDDLHPGIPWHSWHLRLDFPGEGGYIVGSTPYGAWKMHDDVYFDVVIFDEAGQLTLDFALMGMSCANRYVFVGDHKQLPPVLMADHSDPLTARSAFEHLFEKYPSVMLDVTYRMNREVNEFPSRHFYGGRLKCSEGAVGRRLGGDDGGDFDEILNPDLPSVFAEVNHVGMQMRSPEEANLIAHLLVELVCRQGLNPSDVAVIAPYRAQVREIKNRLAKVAGKAGVDIGDELVVDTVERIQGQEREVIIVSFASSDEEYLRNKAGFYFMPNRLNVAITRARVKRILVGSRHAFRLKPTSLKETRMVNVFKKLYRLTPKVDCTEMAGRLG